VPADEIAGSALAADRRAPAELPLAWARSPRSDPASASATPASRMNRSRRGAVGFVSPSWRHRSLARCIVQGTQKRCQDSRAAQPARLGMRPAV